jgi:hypothetical protein
MRGLCARDKIASFTRNPQHMSPHPLIGYTESPLMKLKKRHNQQTKSCLQKQLKL